MEISRVPQERGALAMVFVFGVLSLAGQAPTDLLRHSDARGFSGVLLLTGVNRILKNQLLPGRLTAWSQPSQFGLTIRGFASPDTGRPLLHFLHGNGFCGLAYWPMLSRLQVDFDLLMTDIQGHGDSDPGSRFLGWNANADICTRVLRQHLATGRQSGRPVFGVAHSLGGVLTTLMAADHPDLFDRLVLLDPVYFPKSMLTAMAGLKYAGLLDTFSPLSRQARRRRSSWPSRSAAASYLSGRGTFRNWDKEALDCFVRFAIEQNSDGRFSLKCPTWIEAKIFATYPKRLWRAIKAARVPTELMIAENTFPFLQKSTLKVLRENEYYTARTMKGGHCFMQEYPETSAEAIRTCLLPDG